MIPDMKKMERAFHPRIVAVVGDKKVTDYMWLRGQSEIKGKLYSVQVDPNELDGIKALGIENYKSLMDIPEPVDLVIVAVPRAIAPRILDDCIKKDVAAAHFFTSGFAETDTQEGITLERLLAEKAKAADFHLIGPNCMGLYTPSTGIRQTRRQPIGFDGSVGMIFQSGTHAIAFAEEAFQQGLDINKSVSFGNGVILDAVDYLEYFGQDHHIKAIGMYLEGVRDGRRFLNRLKSIAAQKPVVIWKGGRTEEGGRAIASHTGSLAVPQIIWDSAMKQCGAITVNSLRNLIDSLKALLYLPSVIGPRVGITGGSGGQSVAIADTFAEAGLKVPPLTSSSYEELASFFSLIGGGYRNPIDTGNVNRLQMKRILDILERDDHIDNVVLLTSIGMFSRSGELLDRDVEMLKDIRSRSSKPVAVIIGGGFSQGLPETRNISLKFQDIGSPIFFSLEGGAQALHNALVYNRIKKNIAPLS